MVSLKKAQRLSISNGAQPQEQGSTIRTFQSFSSAENRSCEGITWTPETPDGLVLVAYEGQRRLPHHAPILPGIRIQ